MLSAKNDEFDGEPPVLQRRVGALSWLAPKAKAWFMAASFLFMAASFFTVSGSAGSSNFLALSFAPARHDSVMTHKYRGCIVVLSINKSVESNEEQKVLASSLDQEFTVKTRRQVFSSI